MVRGRRVVAAVVAAIVAVGAASPVDDAAHAAETAFVSDRIGPIDIVHSVAAGPDGSVYAAYYGAILRLDPSGRLVHHAGQAWDTREPLPAADGRPAREMPMAWLEAMTVTPDNSLWIGEYGRVRRIDPGGTVHDLAGDGYATSRHDPTVPTLIGAPTGMDAIDATHVVMSTYGGEVLVVDAAGDVERMTDELVGRQLTDVAVAPDGSFVTSTEDGAVYRIEDGAVTTIVNPSPFGIYRGDFSDGIPAIDAALCCVTGLDVEPDGDVLVATEGRIRRIHDDDGTIGTVVGVRRQGTADGPAGSARFSEVRDLVVAGNDVLVADGARVRQAADAVRAADLPPQPASTPEVTVTPHDPSTTVSPEGSEPPPPSPGPVRLTVTVTSPDGTPIAEAEAFDYPYTEDFSPIATADGGTLEVTLVGAGGHLLTIVSEDELGNPVVQRWRVLISDGEGDPCGAGGTPDDGFSDVPPSNVHETAIDCAVYWRLLVGSGGFFRPDWVATRAQMATVVVQLLQASGVDVPAGPDAFDDDDGSVHEPNINALAAMGVVSGVEPRRFYPHFSLARDQMASFLLRTYEAVIDAPAPPARDRFSDDETSVHEPRIDQAAALGLANGVTETSYEPGVSLRRDQMASFLTRLLARLAADGIEVTRRDG